MHGDKRAIEDFLAHMAEAIDQYRADHPDFGHELVAFATRLVLELAQAKALAAQYMSNDNYAMAGYSTPPTYRMDGEEYLPAFPSAIPTLLDRVKTDFAWRRAEQEALARR